MAGEQLPYFLDESFPAVCGLNYEVLAIHISMESLAIKYDSQHLAFDVGIANFTIIQSVLTQTRLVCRSVARQPRGHGLRHRFVRLSGLSGGSSLTSTVVWNLPCKLSFLQIGQGKKPLGHSSKHCVHQSLVDLVSV